jgi:adenylate kinase family enzyme
MKSKVIEIIGPPGVGKSTIYHSLCRKWENGSQWVYPEVLLTNKPPLFPVRKWMIYRMRLLLHKKLVKTIPVDYGLRFDEQQQQLAKFCWQHLSDASFYGDRDTNKRFRSAYFLFSAFCLYQAIIEKATETPCIIEEGLLQKSFFIRDNEADDQLSKSLLNEYLELVPLPYAIIYIDTPDTNEVVKRLRGRSKVIASHFGKNDEALRRDIEQWRHVQDNILERMKTAGVSIIRINGMQPVKENVTEILKMLKNLNGIREASEGNMVNAPKKDPFKAIKNITQLLFHNS